MCFWKELTARRAANQTGDAELFRRFVELDLGLEHGKALIHGARFTIAKNDEERTRFEDFWSRAVKNHELRE